MQGGGRMQFAMVPLNFLKVGYTAAYIDSGHWAKSAITYAEKYGNVAVIASSQTSNYDHIPTYTNCPQNSAYLHITSNNTIYGTQYQTYPSTGKIPLIADMSSDIFSKKIDVNKFGFIYAVAQKNVGPAGVTLGIIRKDLSAIHSDNIPSILSYNSYVSENSLINTPPVFAIYCSYLNLKLMHQKGIAQIEQENNEKATLLYNYINQSSLFSTNAIADWSTMNVCLQLSDPKLTQSFVDYATKHDIIGVKGHRSVGGLRISLYNAISKQDVLTLINVMQSFEQKPEF